MHVRTTRSSSVVSPRRQHRESGPVSDTVLKLWSNSDEQFYPHAYFTARFDANERPTSRRSYLSKNIARECAANRHAWHSSNTSSRIARSLLRRVGPAHGREPRVVGDGVLAPELRRHRVRHGRERPTLILHREPGGEVEADTPHCAADRRVALPVGRVAPPAACWGPHPLGVLRARVRARSTVRCWVRR